MFVGSCQRIARHMSKSRKSTEQCKQNDQTAAGVGVQQGAAESSLPGAPVHECGRGDAVIGDRPVYRQISASIYAGLEEQISRSSMRNLQG